MIKPGYCFCGKPLHYTDKAAQEMVNTLVDLQGDYVDVQSGVNGQTYKVQRHYIALHGLRGDEVHKLGFEEVPYE